MATIPVTPGQMIWHFAIGPVLDPVVMGWIPERYEFAFDVAKFGTVAFADWKFAGLVVKLIFHETATLTVFQEMKLRWYYRGCTGGALPALGMVSAATLLGTMAAREMHHDSTPLSKMASLGGVPVSGSSQRRKIASLGGF